MSNHFRGRQDFDRDRDAGETRRVAQNLEYGGSTPLFCFSMRLLGERTGTKQSAVNGTPRGDARAGSPAAGALQNYFGLAIAKYPSLVRTNSLGNPLGAWTETLILCHLPSVLKSLGL